MSHQDNIRRIKIVSEALQDLTHKVVFVGGSTVSLYADRQTVVPRVTDDIDAIIEVLSYGDHSNFEAKLRTLGFVDDTTSKIRCRYKLKRGDEELTVDIMPTTDVSMGFKNIWYPEGFKNAIDYVIDADTTIKILAPQYFLATKLEAFKDRGASDPRQSQDFEDIVFVFENRKTIWEEINIADLSLKRYLKEEFLKLVGNPAIFEWIDCHILFGSPPPTMFIIASLREFVGLKAE